MEVDRIHNILGTYQRECKPLALNVKSQSLVRDGDPDCDMIHTVHTKLVQKKDDSSMPNEQEIIRYTEKLVQLFGLDKQNAEVFSLVCCLKKSEY